MADQSLDFFSLAFDAKKALYNTSLHPPVKDAAPLNTIYHCKSLLPPDHPDFFVKQERRADEEPSKARALSVKFTMKLIRFLAPGGGLIAAQARELQKYRVSYIAQKRKQKDRQNPILDIVESTTQGPLVLLRTYFEERCRVSVIIKHDKGIRGVASGVLVAFDKHMNLVLKDVEELYTVLLNVERTTASGKVRRGRKQERRKRQLKQVFIKGNSVVLVRKEIK